MIATDRKYFKVKNSYELTRLTRLGECGWEAIQMGDYYQGFIHIHAIFEQLMYIAVEKQALCESSDINKLNGIRGVSYSSLICSKVDKLLDRPTDRCSVHKPNTLLYIYWYSIYPLRNRIVHRGYTLTKEEAVKSCRIMEEIISEIAKRNDYIKLKSINDV